MVAVNLNRLIADTVERLANAGIENGSAEAELILCDLLNLDRLQLYLQGQALLTPEIIARFESIIARRLTRYPLQYILGSAWFYGRKFVVDESVMIPRPETELLLDLLLRTARKIETTPARVVDIGTGSGVLAISAKLENPSLHVTASDISAEALNVARRNAASFDLEDKIVWVQADLFDFGRNQPFDLIVSNPPYIADGDYDGLSAEVKADPKTALLAGPEGLDVVKRLVSESPRYLQRPGYLLFEFGAGQAGKITRLAQAEGHYDAIEIHKDLADIDRVCFCRLK